MAVFPRLEPRALGRNGPGPLLVRTNNGRLSSPLVLQVATQNLDPDSFQDGYAVLTGTTYSGNAFEGSDEITIVPPEP